LLLAFTADPLVRAVYGAEYAPAAGALELLAIAVVLMIFNAWQGFVLLAAGRQRVTLAYNSVGLVINVILNVILISTAGFIGAAVAALLTSIFITVASGLAGARLVGATLDRVRLPRVALANVLLAVQAWLLGLAGLEWSLVLPLAAVTYPAYLLALRVVTVDELRLAIPLRNSVRPMEIG
jgi:O-antigen/teichoic acid export membrane protein